MIIKLNHQPSGGKEWIAEIVGRDKKFTFKRKFLFPIAKNWSSSGKTGTTSFEVMPGKVYEVQEPYKGRRFIKVENGNIQKVSEQEVLETF